MCLHCMPASNVVIWYTNLPDSFAHFAKLCIVISPCSHRAFDVWCHCQIMSGFGFQSCCICDVDLSAVFCSSCCGEYSIEM